MESVEEKLKESDDVTIKLKSVSSYIYIYIYIYISLKYFAFRFMSGIQELLHHHSNGTIG